MKQAYAITALVCGFLATTLTAYAKPAPVKRPAFSANGAYVCRISRGQTSWDGSPLKYYKPTLRNGVWNYVSASDVSEASFHLSINGSQYEAWGPAVPEVIVGLGSSPNGDFTLRVVPSHGAIRVGTKAVYDRGDPTRNYDLWLGGALGLHGWISDTKTKDIAIDAVHFNDGSFASIFCELDS